MANAHLPNHFILAGTSSMPRTSFEVRHSLYFSRQLSFAYPICTAASKLFTARKDCYLRPCLSNKNSLRKAHRRL